MGHVLNGVHDNQLLPGWCTSHNGITAVHADKVLEFFIRIVHMTVTGIKSAEMVFHAEGGPPPGGTVSLVYGKVHQDINITVGQIRCAVCVPVPRCRNGSRRQPAQQLVPVADFNPGGKPGSISVRRLLVIAIGIVHTVPSYSVVV